MIPCQIAGRSWLLQGEPEARLETLPSAISDPAHPPAAWALLCPGLKSPLCWAESSPLYGPCMTPCCGEGKGVSAQTRAWGGVPAGGTLAIVMARMDWGLGRVAVDSGS